jgi:hypothetical protein
MRTAASLALHILILAAGWRLAGQGKPPWDAGPRPGSGPEQAVTAKSDRARSEPGEGIQLLNRIIGEAGGEDPAPAESRDARQALEAAVIACAGDATESGDPWNAPRGEDVRRHLEAVLRGAGTPDLAFAFRHGLMTAAQIHRDLAALMPEHAAQPEFTTTLYRHLAPADPARAMELLDGMPEEDRVELQLETATTMAAVAKPDEFRAMIETVPLATDPGSLEDRLQAWFAAYRGASGHYRDEFPQWAESLPPGRDRDFAMVTLFYRSVQEDPGSAERYRDQIADPAVRARSHQ